MNGIQFQWVNDSKTSIFPTVFPGDFTTDRPPYPLTRGEAGPIIHLVPLGKPETNPTAQSYRCYYSSGTILYEAMLSVNGMFGVSVEGKCKLSTYQNGEGTVYVVTFSSP